MSIPDRVFRLSKSYLNQVRDRIDAELSDAERELNADSTTSPGGIDAPDEERRARLYRDNDPEAMIRRAEARIAAARREVESRGGDAGSGGTAPQTPVAAPATAAQTPPPTPPKNTQTSAEAEGGDPNYHDYRVLGVPIGGDLAQVQSEYEKLSRRLDPTRLSFPEGSTEQKQAMQIMERINAAYDALRRRLDPTLQRMTHLELE